jgi:hypothetical protein
MPKKSYKINKTASFYIKNEQKTKIIFMF